MIFTFLHLETFRGGELCIRKFCGGKAHFAILMLTRWCILYCDDQSKPLYFQTDDHGTLYVECEFKLRVESVSAFLICTHITRRVVVNPRPETFGPMST